MSCTVCQHPQCREIDQALITKTATLAALSQQHGLSQTTLHRHKQHLLKKMQQTQQRFQDNLLLGYHFKLNLFLELATAVANTSQAEGNSGLVLRAITLGARLINFMHKLEFNPDPETVYRLLAEPEWSSQGSLLPTDPRFLHPAIQTLAQSLSSLCPDPAVPDDSLRPDGHPGNDTAPDLPADLDLDLAQTLVSELTQSIPSNSDSPPPTLPANRKKGGKKPSKTQSPQAFSQENHRPNKPIKNIAKNPVSKPVSHHQAQTANQNLFLETPKWLQAIDARLLDVNDLPAIGAGRGVSPDFTDIMPSP